MRNANRWFFFIAILFFVILSSWQMVRGSIVFHTDIARDFLLLEEMVQTKKPALIGPRSGGIPGVFHGPAWIYLNLPAFILGQGNPVVVGWFWVLLFISCLAVVYYAGKKLFSEEIALWSTLIVAATSSESISSLFNPFGAVLLAPVFIFFYLRYFISDKFRDLAICLFVLGFIIQFQMAFGAPILVMVSIHILYRIIKNRKFTHLIAFGVLLIPLSTFLIFDIRHQFLQTSSVLNYVRGAENMGKSSLHPLTFITLRAKEAALTFPGMFTRGQLVPSLLFLGVFMFLFIKKSFSKTGNADRSTYLILLLYSGYWILTLVFKGTIWSYYYWPFLPLLAYAFTHTLIGFNKKLGYILLGGLVLFNGFSAVQTLVMDKGSNNTGSWQFYFSQAKKIYEDAPREFGYYIYTADQFGYSSRYAMNYVQQSSLKKAYPYAKKHNTYLLIFPSSNPYTSEHWWKANQVKLNRKADEVFKYPGGSYIEKHELNEDELKVSSDPNLINSLIFR